MQFQLSTTLHFLHLENAIFCAEQCISNEIKLIEISSSLLKHVGMHSLQFFHERFPDTYLIIDAKILKANKEEWKIFSESGAKGLTISAAISNKNLDLCLELAKQYDIEIFLDFRNCDLDLIAHHMHNLNKADYILLDWVIIFNTLCIE